MTFEVKVEKDSLKEFLYYLDHQESDEKFNFDLYNTQLYKEYAIVHVNKDQLYSLLDYQQDIQKET